MAAVHGLTDLFRIAAEWSEPVEPDAIRRQIRVSHWTVTSDAVACTWDSHPGDAHSLTHVVAPPSLVMPLRMRPMPLAAGWMNARHSEGAVACSVCAGAFVLAESGLLDGRRATTHWAFAETLAARFPEIQVAAEAMIIDEGDIMTAGGILAWADLGLTLVDRLLGPSTMLATARFLLVDPPRGAQGVYRAFIPSLDHGDAAVLRAQHHLHATSADPQSIPALAALSGLAGRTFLRRFARATGLRPTEYLQQVRIMKARDALELTNSPVDQISWKVGYADVSAFRRVFQRVTGVPPNAYRARFSRRRAPGPLDVS
ncbi:GlxA family transcriptional regulator [uncultured Brevundimonas sp.]|uniref:GlxA family transcriptional regulator n=1 Tax=uncultured Brevundimonas sp. TaxID=213418 RepID=UPI00260EB4E6|nr:helix-turn-helix domain-containing protein [uncultured Brevundimonas sp.]